MKKIYTLFAFAALCVSGCTNDITEGGNISSKYNTVTLEAVAHTDDDDTRALFDESGKKLVWDLADGHTEQNLSVIELHDDECAEGLSSRVECSNACEGVFNAEKTANTTNSNKAIFDVTLKAQTAGCYSYLAAYPKDALVAFCQGKKAEMTLPDKQTPSALENLDPKSTLLFAVDNNGENGKYEGARPYNLDLQFNHVASYAKMTIKGLPLMKKGATLEGKGHASETLVNPEVVDHIVFTADDENTALAGVYSFDYSNKTGSATEGVNSITLDVKGLGIDADKGDFTVCFAVLPTSFTGFTVKVVTTEGHVYTKSFSNKLEFTRAHVKPFGLNFSGVEAEEAVYLKAYKKLKGTPEGGFVSGKNYVITATVQSGLRDTYTYLKDNSSSSTEGISTESVDITVTDDYLLCANKETFNSYSWNISDGKIYHDNIGWNNDNKGLGNLVFYAPDTKWKFNYNEQNGFVIEDQQVNRIIDLSADNSSINWRLCYSSQRQCTVDIYEDCEYYWGQKTDTEVEEKPDVYRKVSTITNGNVYIITAESNSTVYAMKNDTLAAVPLFGESEGSAGFTDNGDTIEGTDDSYTFKAEVSGTRVFFQTLNSSSNYLTLSWSGSVSLGSKPFQGFLFTYSNNKFYLRDSSAGMTLYLNGTTWGGISTTNQYVITLYELQQ